MVTFGSRAGGPWSGRILENNGASLMLSITSTPSAIVGKYRVYVAIDVGSGIQRTRRDPSTDLYMLVNAWCPGTDSVSYCLLEAVLHSAHTSLEWNLIN